MSSEEDFCLVTDLHHPAENTLEGVKILISNHKKKHEQLLQEQKVLATSRADQRHLTHEFRQRTERLTQSLKMEEQLYMKEMESEKAKLTSLIQEEVELMMEIQKVEAALKEKEAQCSHLKQQTDVLTASPERRVYFNGATAEADGAQTFDVEPRIVYPMEGGTVLVTFEKEEVAKKILDMKKHQVDLGGEFSITVEARPVYLMMPSLLEVDVEVCPKRILMSNLPKMDRESVQDKLQIHFSRKRNGGGEVEDCDLDADSWTAVLTFLEENIAKSLTDAEYHEVEVRQKKHRVRVTPFLNGIITNLKTRMSACPRTLLLTGIPAVKEQETLQDMLEIHFQKTSNGGGEIEALFCNPLGQNASAVFEGVFPNPEADLAV